MNTLPQGDTKDPKDSRSVRIREDVWEAARREAYEGKTSIVAVLDRALRGYFGLPADTDEAAGAAH